MAGMIEQLSGMFGIATNLMYIMVLAVVGLTFIAVMGGVGILIGLYLRYNKYKCLIFDKRINKEGKESLFFVGIDKAGIVKDRKLKKYYFRLSKNKVRLEPGLMTKEGATDIPSIPNLKGGEVVFLERLAPKRFAFLDPMVIDGHIEAKITTEDTAEAFREYDLNIRTLGNQNKALIIAVSIIALSGFIIGLMWMMNGKQLKEIAEIFKQMLPTLTELVKARGASIASTAPG